MNAYQLSQAVITLLLATDRSNTAPVLALILSCILLVVQLVLLVETPLVFQWNQLPLAVTLFVNVSMIMIIVGMPLRDPRRPRDDISSAFEIPTSSKRSPEDALTLWQFMSVSWLSPLISLGKAKQLVDEDVWGLGYEFRHRQLHDKFRELPGSVLRRLLRANGLDLLIITFLSLVEMIASM